MDYGVTESRVAAIQLCESWSWCCHLPLSASHTRRRRDDVEPLFKRERRNSLAQHGDQSVHLALADAQRELAEARAWADIGRSADFDRPYPAVLSS